MNKFSQLKDIKVDCTRLFNEIISGHDGLFGVASKKNFTKIFSNFNKVKRTDKEAIIQYHSLLCELRFMCRVISEKQTIRRLEDDENLQNEIGINGCNLDFLVGEDKVCEITSIKELDEISEDNFDQEKGVICANRIKPKILGRLTEKISGDRKCGQIGKCLKLYPGIKVNLVLYLPLSCDYDSLESAVVKGDLACVFEPNGRGQWKDTGKITKSNGRKLDTLMTSFIERYYEEIRCIFILSGEKIYYVARNDTKYILMESPGLSQILI